MEKVSNERLLKRLNELGQIGRDVNGILSRTAASDADKLGRDQLVSWMLSSGLDVEIDQIGNIFGIWRNEANLHRDPIMIGSHIDTVIDAGIYDGTYGVLSGLGVIETLKSEGLVPKRPIAVAAFTNEEGVRYAPDMMGSLACAGGLEVEEALNTTGVDSSTLGEELTRIGYAGEHRPGHIKPHAFIELHIEQGPVLETENATIGVVEDLQGISWQKITIHGEANHAGTTPMHLRHDAGHAAAKIMTFLRELATGKNKRTVATVGSIQFEPNAINVIPSKAVFTIDLRNPRENQLLMTEQALEKYMSDVSALEGVEIIAERLVRFDPVTFDGKLVSLIEHSASVRKLRSKRMTSGAGHDAQMMSRICPSAMIFVPSVNGISHNPNEYTKPEDLAAGASVLLDVVKHLALRD